MRNIPILPVEIGPLSWSCVWRITVVTVPELTAVNMAGVRSSARYTLFVLSLRGRGRLWRLGSKQKRRLNKWHVRFSAVRGVMTRHLLLLLSINGGLQPNVEGACFHLQSQWRSVYGWQHVWLHLPQINVSRTTSECGSARSERILSEGVSKSVALTWFCFFVCVTYLHKKNLFHFPDEKWNSKRLDETPTMVPSGACLKKK